MWTASDDAVILLGGTISPRSTEAMVTWVQNLTPAPAAAWEKWIKKRRKIEWLSMLTLLLGSCMVVLVWLFLLSCLPWFTLVHVHKSAFLMYKWFAAPQRWIRKWWKTCLDYFFSALYSGSKDTFSALKGVQISTCILKLQVYENTNSASQWCSMTLLQTVGCISISSENKGSFCRLIEVFTGKHH